MTHQEVYEFSRSLTEISTQELARVPLQNLVLKFSLKVLQFCCAESWEFRAEVFSEVFFALSVPAKQARRLREKLRRKLRKEMRANNLSRDMFKPFRSHNGLLR